MNILLTGAAGFIGFHTARALLARGHTVTGVDNLNTYYDPALKQARLDILARNPAFTFRQVDIADRRGVETLFAAGPFDRVVHLAAQAGVRYSILNPHTYIDCNITGFLNILEGCRHARVPHCVFASSSSVYGANTKMPFSERDRTDHPVSLYAATKKANEMMAHTYSSLYGTPLTGLRFFTVYGPFGRPDMAYFKFTKNIIEGRPIEVFNNGRHARDFTYIDDVVEGVVRVMDKIPEATSDWDDQRPDRSYAPYRIYNIGNTTPVELETFIGLIEQAAGKKAERVLLAAQPGDVEQTFADVSALYEAVGFKPSTPLATGIAKFVAWYRDFYGVA